MASRTLRSDRELGHIFTPHDPERSIAGKHFTVGNAIHLKLAIHDPTVDGHLVALNHFFDDGASTAVGSLDRR